MTNIFFLEKVFLALQEMSSLILFFLCTPTCTILALIIYIIGRILNIQTMKLLLSTNIFCIVVTRIALRCEDFIAAKSFCCESILIIIRNLWILMKNI